MKANKVLIIAEAGVNHNGDFELAKKLVDAAAEAGADYVKFQTFKASKIVNRTARKAEYQAKNLATGDVTQYEMLKSLEMPEEWHYQLDKYAKDKKIAFLSTGFDEDSIDFLDTIGSPLFKIPSGEITNRPYLEHIGSKGKPVILSTGMADMADIRACMDILYAQGISKQMITVLHCNTEYPTPMTDVNLLAMNAIQHEFGVSVGYSDHTLGIEVPIAAVALGATVIEKHFTLDRSMPGPDHRASLEPQELKAMVAAIRNIELAISGSAIKEPSPSEIKNKEAARKSIHLKTSLQAGHVVRLTDLEMKRPGNGISPMDLDKVIGKKLRTELPEEWKLSFNDIE
jgi:N,N'-diacetyllegionaminate synthase